MGMQGDIARESETRFLCEKLVQKIELNPVEAKVLKEFGIEMLENLPNIPDWAREYYKLFRS